ncbi:hypothetical protein L1887_04432 [Cichorium endivia]|nr:hypothetical protein L1887_04432 [Cichorium endivia]
MIKCIRKGSKNQTILGEVLHNPLIKHVSIFIRKGRKGVRVWRHDRLICQMNEAPSVDNNCKVTVLIFYQ